MRMGMIGMGRMGANMVRRLLGAGHECVVYDVSSDAVRAIVAHGATGADSLQQLVSRLSPPRSVWLMVPAAATKPTLDAVAADLAAGDVIVDGGNSDYRDDIRRAQELAERGIHYVDAGVSGGVWGLEGGYCLMVGGPAEAVQRLEPALRALAPGVAAAARGKGRTGEVAAAEQGYLHCGPSGAGHFVKMVHNGIEYGLMAAYAEGLNILRHANAGREQQERDAETAPLRDPEAFQYDFDLAAIAEVWRRGSVIRSWLLDLTAAALLEDPNLSAFSGRVSDSGEGRWTLHAAVDEGVPAPVLSLALAERLASQDQDRFARKLLSAMRHEFGGHQEKKS
jgi:6-phosphogluconate dehydrogenase